MIFDVAIVGGGPAGSACAAVCARAGLKTLLIERAVFPREKICGDCLNPACWPVLDRLGVSKRVLNLPHSLLREVEFVGLDGRHFRVRLDGRSRGEIAIKRSALDQLLLARAAELGAEIHQGCTLTAIEPGWTLIASGQSWSARLLVGADGRNSTVARLLNLLPPSARERVAWQTHAPAPPGFGEKVMLCFLPRGYCGVATVGHGEVNICLVARPENLAELKAWAAARFAMAEDQSSRTITPLTRGAVAPVHENLLLVGDAARVVEPFTGEGIFYALASGELAGTCIVAGDLHGFERAHTELYRGRLWVNHLSRFAATHPRFATAFLRAAQFAPEVLRALTSKVVHAPDSRET